MDLVRNWRLRHQRYKLEGARCDACGTTIFPARPVCPQCRSRSLQPFQFSGRGEAYSWTYIVQPPQEFEQYRPYIVALVRLEEGPLVTAQLTDVDPAELHVGMPLEMVTRKLVEQGDSGLIVYGYKFRPPLKVGSNGHREASALADTVPQYQAVPVPARQGPHH